MLSPRILVQAADFEAGAELARLAALGGGGIASFIGVVRGDDGLQALTLEHYPGMTERAVGRMAAAAAARWPLLGVTIIHRVGRLQPGAQIVLVAAASRHRAAALEATGFLIDYLKTAAPFWKREEFAGGVSAWVGPRDADAAAAAAWQAR